MYPKATTLVNIIIITKYFENLTVRLHILYALNIYVKFCDNQILFTILFIRLYFMHNFKLQKLYDKKKITKTYNLNNLLMTELLIFNFLKIL